MEGLDLTALQDLVDKNPKLLDGQDKPNNKKNLNEEDLDFLNTDDLGLVKNHMSKESKSLEEFEKSKIVSKNTSDDLLNTSDEDEDEDDETNPNLNNTGNNSTDDLYKPWAENWKEKGYIDFDEKEYTEAEDKEKFIYEKFEDKYDNDIEEYKKSFIENLDPVIKNLIDMQDEGIDFSKFVRHEINIASYEKIDPLKLAENVNLQKRVIKDYLLKTTAETEKEADEELADYEERDLLAKKADIALPKLVKLEKQYQQADIKAQKAELKKQEDNYHNWVKETNKFISDTKEVFPGIKLSDKEKKQLVNMLTVYDKKTGLTEYDKLIAEDPKRFNMLSAYMAMKNWNISDLEKIANTKVSQKIKSSVNTTTDDKKNNKDDKLNLSVWKKVLKK